MAYAIVRTDKADFQIRELISYIAKDSGSVEVALSYLNKLEHTIMLLKEQPYYGVSARDPILRSMNFRVLVVEHHLVFYKVRERDTSVIIYAVVDYRQDYFNLIM